MQSRPHVSPVPAHLQSFLEHYNGAWGVFDERYMRHPHLMPSDYEPGLHGPIARYCIGRVSEENVRLCLYAFNHISECKAAKLGVRAVSDRQCRRMAQAVLNGLNGLTDGLSDGYRVRSQITA
jgi:hypothetical protein